MREDVHQLNGNEVGTSGIVMCIVPEPISGEILTVQGSRDLFHPHTGTYIKVVGKLLNVSWWMLSYVSNYQEFEGMPATSSWAQICS